jgi:hypothetical protein
VSTSLHQLLPNSDSRILWSSGYDSRLGPATAVDCERPPVRVRARSFFCLSSSLLNVPIGLVLGVGNQIEVLCGLRACYVETMMFDDALTSSGKILFFCFCSGMICGREVVVGGWKPSELGRQTVRFPLDPRGYKISWLHVNTCPQTFKPECRTAAGCCRNTRTFKLMCAVCSALTLRVTISSQITLCKCVM